MEAYKICTLVPAPPENDQSINVQVEDDWPEDRPHLGQYALEWTNHANIKMVFVDDAAEAEIRVTFKKGGSWSMVGMDCFGHALGCVHEHQSPIQGIRWDEQKVYEYDAREMGWDSDTVDRNSE
ncbi:hypothetical protein CIB48_g2597 [Xylaria polymorpha]|nr:hypothetical protein CIB48_g2597 [Xylaria polymorpha]